MAEWQIGHQKSHPALSACFFVVNCVPVLLLNHSLCMTWCDINFYCIVNCSSMRPSPPLPPLKQEQKSYCTWFLKWLYSMIFINVFIFLLLGSLSSVFTTLSWQVTPRKLTAVFISRLKYSIQIKLVWYLNLAGNVLC